MLWCQKLKTEKCQIHWSCRKGICLSSADLEDNEPTCRENTYPGSRNYITWHFRLHSCTFVSMPFSFSILPSFPLFLLLLIDRGLFGQDIIDIDDVWLERVVTRCQQ